MTSFPNSPKLLKDGIVHIDPESLRVQRIISSQYIPDSLSRTLQVQGVGDSGDRSEPVRLKGPAVETIKLDAEVDATDQLEFPDQNRNAVEHGIQPQLAVLEAKGWRQRGHSIFCISTTPQACQTSVVGLYLM